MILLLGECLHCSLSRLKVKPLMFTVFTWLQPIKLPPPRCRTTASTPSCGRRTSRREHGFEPLAIEGKLPADLRGTLYRNGPGQFGQFGQRYSHPFEADGAVTAVRFADGKAPRRVAHHASAGLVEERAAGKMLYGLRLPWPRAIANMSRPPQEHREHEHHDVAGPAVRADGGGRADRDRSADLVDARRDRPRRHRSCRCSRRTRTASRRARRPTTSASSTAASRSCTCTSCPTSAGAPSRRGRAARRADAARLHRDRHAPRVLRVADARRRAAHAAPASARSPSCSSWKPELGTEVICVPIDRPSEPVRFTTEAFYQWHFTNAFTAAASSSSTTCATRASNVLRNRRASRRRRRSGSSEAATTAP